MTNLSWHEKMLNDTIPKHANVGKASHDKGFWEFLARLDDYFFVFLIDNFFHGKKGLDYIQQ